MEQLLISLNIAGLVLVLFFVSIILSKKNKLLKDYLLTFFLLLLGSYLLIKYTFQFDLYNAYPIIVYLDIYYWVLLGPTLYIYTLLSTRGENHLRWVYILTLIPAILVSFSFYSYMFGDVTDLFDDPVKSKMQTAGIYIWLFNSPVFYFLTFFELREHQKRIKQQYSYKENIDFKWLYYLSNGFGIFILFLMFRPYIQNWLQWDFPFENYSLSMFVAFLYILGIGYYGYKQGSIFNYKKEEQKKQNASYKKSGLNEDEAVILKEKLEVAMKKEKLFLDSELHLSGLAEKMNVSSQKLSQVINENLHKNFFDFINEYRVEEVKTYLSNSNYNHVKVISLAYDSGFNSKSTFYNFFKKSEGITPSEFRIKSQ